PGAGQPPMPGAEPAYADDGAAAPVPPPGNYPPGPGYGPGQAAGVPGTPAPPPGFPGGQDPGMHTTEFTAVPQSYPDAGHAPTADEFAQRRAVRPPEPVAQMGIRAAIRKSTLGLVRLGPG